MEKNSKKNVASDKSDGNNTIVPVLQEVAGRIRFGSCLVRVEFHNGRISKFETFDEHKKYVLKSS